MTGPRPVRVLVAEDSTTTREFLVEILRTGGLEVVGQAKSGLEALEMTKALRPDVVTMDIRMPGMDGLEATKRIMIEAPTPIVIVSGSRDVREVEVTMHALRAGALTALPKPEGPGSLAFEESARIFADTVRAMSQVKVVRHWPDRPSPDAAGSGPERNGRVKGRVVAIAASTGGPAALARILSDLPGSFPVPILVVQHMAAGFAEGVAFWLNQNSSLRVQVAKEGETLQAGRVYLAPDHHHLGVADRSTIHLSSDPPIGGFRPSGTHLFNSVADTFGPAAVAVILTGMGEDGVKGLAAVKHAGGRVVAQDEGSSVVFGMPGAAVAAGCVDHVLPLASIAFRLGEWV